MQLRWFGVWVTVLVLSSGCVDPDLGTLPCPCATGFRCVEDRCVPNRRVDASFDGSADDASFDAGRDVSVDAFERDVEDSGTSVVWRFQSGSFDLRASPDCQDAAGALRIGGGQPTCTYLTDVLDAGGPVRLLHVSWMPRGPYAKPLPPIGTVERYARDNVDLRDVVLMLRMDSEDAVAIDGSIPDSSGMGNDCEVRGGVALPTTGPLGRSMLLGTNTRCELETVSNPELQLDTSDFSWTMWFPERVNAFETAGC
jgi:hypothetical protein